MTAYTLTGIVLAIYAVLVYWAIRRAGIFERALTGIRTQLTANREIEERRRRDEEMKIAGFTAQLDRIQEEMRVRLADLALDIRNQAGDMRELVRGYAEGGRSQANRQLQELITALNTYTTRADTLAADLAQGKLEIAALVQRAADLQQALAASNDRVSRFSDVLRDLVSRISAPLQSQPAQPAVNAFPIDERFLDLSETEMVVAAGTLAYLRPLAPYPGWRFDADWSNPDLAFQLRQWVWQRFHDHRWQTPVVANWHGGSRLHLYLGNDLSRQIYVGGCIDPNELVFLDRYLRPGMTFLDAGANEGIYAVFAATRVGVEGLVWAFEPSRREVERLRSNLELNGLQAVIFTVALADSEAPAPLKIAGYEHEGQNTLGSFVYEGIETEAVETVQAMPLDEIVKRNSLARLDVMKVDVEGAELRLFRGAATTLEQYRPILLFEVSDESLRRQGGSQEELLGFLEAQGYSLFFFDPQSGLPMPATGASHSDNMIGVPQGMRLPEAVYKPWPGRP